MAQRYYAVCDGCGREEAVTNEQKLRGCSLGCVKQFVDLQPDERLV
jgi:hypothetical protein